MELQLLRLLVTEAELANHFRQQLADQDELAGAELSLLSEGIQVKGEYPSGFGFKVPYETLWTLQVVGATIRATLTEVKVGGMPAGLIRGALLRMVRDAIASQPGFQVEDESIVCDVPVALCELGLEIKVAFTGIQTQPGVLLLEAGQ